MTEHEIYMQRCLQLAVLGAGEVSPNPMVGAVLVHNGNIIGEGWHQKFGGPHAEVNCISSVKQGDFHKINESTLYVSLEPCTHFGKTPPCTDLIVNQKIPKVVIGCRDPFSEVNGKGIEKLKLAGVDVTEGILQKGAMQLNKRFFTFHSKKRPYIILKWAQTADGMMAGAANTRLKISNEITNRLVHKWRTEEASILVGTNTAMLDNPFLTSRHWPGKSPVRVLVDLSLRLPESLHIFNNEARTIVINSLKTSERKNISYYKVPQKDALVVEIADHLFREGIDSLLVEGGAQTLQSFIDEGLWDEARVITGQKILAGPKGKPAPCITRAKLSSSEIISGDAVEIFIHNYEK